MQAAYGVYTGSPVDYIGRCMTAWHPHLIDLAEVW